jgi:hypothetical protein
VEGGCITRIFTDPFKNGLATYRRTVRAGRQRSTRPATKNETETLRDLACGRTESQLQNVNSTFDVRRRGEGSRHKTQDNGSYHQYFKSNAVLRRILRKSRFKSIIRRSASFSQGFFGAVKSDWISAVLGTQSAMRYCSPQTPALSAFTSEGTSTVRQKSFHLSGA